MKHITFWFDVVSPYAYLAFERMPQALEGISHEVEYRPLLFGALLSHWGHKGPAEIEPKRQWTFRHVQWLAHQQGVPLHPPAQHPFNPLPLQRLAVACGGDGGCPNRRVVEAIFHHVWRSQGADANDPARLDTLTDALAPALAPGGPEVKQRLRSATEEAVQHGLFGVPSFEADGRLFWGLDSLDMLACALRGDDWFSGPAWDEAGAPRPGIVRR